MTWCSCPSAIIAIQNNWTITMFFEWWKRCTAKSYLWHLLIIIKRNKEPLKLHSFRKYGSLGLWATFSACLFFLSHVNKAVSLLHVSFEPSLLPFTYTVSFWFVRLSSEQSVSKSSVKIWLWPECLCFFSLNTNRTSDAFGFPGCPVSPWLLPPEFLEMVHKFFLKCLQDWCLWDHLWG